MTKLLLVELTRLRWRRAALVLLAACFLVPALVWGGWMWNTRPVSDADLRQAQAQVDQFRDDPSLQREIDRCVQHPRQYGVPPDADEASLREACAEMMGPTIEMYLYREQLDIAQGRIDTGAGVITILIGLIMLIGTTFIGHDWNSGSMSNQLLFEPRRIRVWGAKALIVFGVGLVTSLLALAGFWAATAAVAAQRNLTVPPGTWDLIRDSALRGVLLASLAGVGAYALTMLFRSTVATLGIMFGVSVGGSILIAVILQEHAERWMLYSNVYAWLFDGYDFYDESLCRGGFSGNYSGDGSECMAHLSQSAGASYLLVILVVSVALSVWSFRRRDVP
jgi:ABC-2 type transport system permease protein